MDNRFKKLNFWLENSLNLTVNDICPASTDASFRRYFRVQTDDGLFIVMDAPPEKESLTEFIEIDRLLKMQEVNVPTIYAQDQQSGFLLLEDFGNKMYLDHLMSDSELLYGDAINTLIRIQLGVFDNSEHELPLYSTKQIKGELSLFTQWYLAYHAKVELDEQQFTIWQNLSDFLVDIFNQQPQVWVHRDYHSRNLMLTEQNSPGVIDFQDMVIGPISYDLASIFKDCYIRWPRQHQLHWLGVYLDRLKTSCPALEISLTDLIRWYDFTSLQRHLKVLGIFSRLNYRDNKNQYLLDIPLVERYISETVSLYAELAEFDRVFQNILSQSQSS